MSRQSIASLSAGLFLISNSFAQLVGLPAPRLLTVLPMGGQVGTQVEVTVSGEEIENASALLFSDPKIEAKPLLGPDGKALPNKFLVSIGAEASTGLHEARLLTRLGVSTPRVFSIGKLPEVTRLKPNSSLQTAMELKLDSICNAVTTRKAVDFYRFEARKGQRTMIECAAAGIDSKLNPVLIIADAEGHELKVDRNNSFLEFLPPEDGTYLIKVHGLTFQGGPEFFYRLALLNAPGTQPVPHQPATLAVNAFSWPSDLVANLAATKEIEPNNQETQAQKITLPCLIEGNFFPAADVDTFEFEAKKSEVWWVEVVSERLGFATNPFALVQKVGMEGGHEKLTDVLELNDIASPMKPSTNGYSYDGPPYDAGSGDILGKLEIKEDGRYRLHLRDLFGGTRSEPRNAYKLMIRKAAPDFALVGWAFHMNLRNGDRNALSKPTSLRRGTTMALEVTVIRRDGFEGDIELGVNDLPAGVSASGLKIAAGKSQGTLLLTAAEDAPAGFKLAKLFGRAEINGASVSRPCRLASMVWPVRDASQEIPDPRLLGDVLVSVSDAEGAPISIAATENKLWEAKAGEKLTIPLKLTWRGEFTGALKLKAFGCGFEALKEFDVALKAASAEAVVDLAALKTVPGDYTLAFYGSDVTKYRDNPEAVKAAEEELKKTTDEAAAGLAAISKLVEEAKSAAPEKKAEAEAAAKLASDKQKAVEALKAEAAKRVKVASDRAMPKDIVDIVVSEPIRIRVQPAEKK